MALPKIVLANGCFDLFHIGHLRYLRAAREMGDSLIVSVTRNAFVNKGPGRPLYDEMDRLQIVSAMGYTAVLVDSSLQALETVRPSIFVKGREYEGKITPEDEEFCRANNIEIRFTDTEVKRPHDRLRQG